MIPKNVLVDAIMGRKIPAMTKLCRHLETKKLVNFTGNQHNISYEWVRDELELEPTFILRNLYVELGGKL